MKPIVADLHMHTLVSGHAYGTIREMAAGAAEKKLQLIGITEHGPGIPGTCDPIYYLNFMAAPRKLYNVEILYGCEVNIRTGGSLALGRRYLDALDYAIAGIHGAMKMKVSSKTLTALLSVWLIPRCVLSLTPMTADTLSTMPLWHREQRNTAWRWKSTTVPCPYPASAPVAWRIIGVCSLFVWNTVFQSW